MSCISGRKSVEVPSVSLVDESEPLSSLPLKSLFWSDATWNFCRKDITSSGNALWASLDMDMERSIFPAEWKREAAIFATEYWSILDDRLFPFSPSDFSEDLILKEELLPFSPGVFSADLLDVMRFPEQILLWPANSCPSSTVHNQCTWNDFWERRINPSHSTTYCLKH